MRCVVLACIPIGLAVVGVFVLIVATALVVAQKAHREYEELLRQREQLGR